MISSAGKRITAHFLDSMILGVISFMLLFLFLIPLGIVSLLNIKELILEMTFLYSMFIAVVMIGIQIHFWSKSTSIGKKILGMIIVDKKTGNPIGLGRMLIREIIGKYISGFFLSLGFIWILFDDEKQGWHDKIVSTVVIDK
ncbi:RDD family protein [Alkaliphilus sp. B6464]|uniref:RDD family protein n=1 Tax=Alkaliphilus sp. B6464 TaxID=2731219 RepID=UPI001BA9B77D|nr:RDD family protein [Alkaliphilus sp. B6464]QUH22219.1 RDD family protein [Alkaliphilus sp. B6464]